MPRFTHVHDLVPPPPPDICELAIFPVAVVPFALAALEHRIPKYVWADDSYLRGNQLIRSMQMAILCGGLLEITQRQDALYRMLDTALYGRVYSIDATEPELIVSPAIAPIHALGIEDEESIFGRMEDQKELLQNALNGTETALYDQPVGIRELLDLIKLAVEAGSQLDDDMLAKLAEIALALA